MADQPTELPVDLGSMLAGRFPPFSSGANVNFDVCPNPLDFLRREGIDRKDCERCFVVSHPGGLRIDALPQIHDLVGQTAGAAFPADLLVVNAERRRHGSKG
jgi:hypothetical protein